METNLIWVVIIILGFQSMIFILNHFLSIIYMTAFSGSLGNLGKFPVM